MGLRDLVEASLVVLLFRTIEDEEAEADEVWDALGVRRSRRDRVVVQTAVGLEESAPCDVESATWRRLAFDPLEEDRALFLFLVIGNNKGERG